MRKLLAIASFIIVWIPAVSFAATFSSGTGTDFNSMVHAGGGGSDQPNQPLGTGFSNTGGYVIFHMKGNGTTGYVGAQIREWASAADFAADGNRSHGTQIDATPTNAAYMAMQSTGDYDLTWNYTAALDPTKFYSLQFFGADVNTDAPSAIYGNASTPNATGYRTLNGLCSFTSGCPENYGPLQQLSYDFTDAGGPTIPITNTTTRIDTVTPADKSTIATSTSATMGATGYINSLDFTNGMFVQIRYALKANSLVSVANTSLLFTEIRFPITSAGAFTMTTTTPVTRAGVYTMQTKIRNGSIYNDVLNFIGFTDFANFAIKTATSTTFTAAAPNQFDLFVGSTTKSIDDYIASSTVDFSSCSSWTGFDLFGCLNTLFIPQFAPVAATLNDFKNGFLSYFPWGYVTRTIVIFSGNGTTTIPLFHYDIGFEQNGKPVYLANSYTVDVNDMFAGGAALADATHVDVGGTDVTFRDAYEPMEDFAVAIMVTVAIFYDMIRFRGRARRMGGKLS